MKFVLFDIDGTLLSTRGAGRRAMEAALAHCFGTAGPADYRYDGKTDRQIARDLMRAAGFDDSAIDARMSDVLDRYLTCLHTELARTPDAIDIHDGVRDLLAALEARADVILGLLTGNIVGGAHAKLSAVNLEPDRFRVGAFGSDDERRAALPGIARTRASAMVGREVRGDALVIIGDTPHDVTCGAEVGARAIAVATGHYRATTLAEYGPAAVFEDLTQTDRVVHAIVSS